MGDTRGSEATLAQTIPQNRDIFLPPLLGEETNEEIVEEHEVLKLLRMPNSTN